MNSADDVDVTASNDERLTRTAGRQNGDSLVQKMGSGSTDGRTSKSFGRRSRVSFEESLRSFEENSSLVGEGAGGSGLVDATARTASVLSAGASKGRRFSGARRGSVQSPLMSPSSEGESGGAHGRRASMRSQPRQ